MTRLFLFLSVFVVLLLPGLAMAFDLEDSLQQLHPQYEQHQPCDRRTVQGGCMTLSQAVESVRRRGDVERIISADTKRSGGRETHHIRYMTKNGTVKTAKIRGC